MKCNCGACVKHENMGKHIVEVCDNCNITYVEEDVLRELNASRKCGYCERKIERVNVGKYIGYACSDCGKIFLSLDNIRR